MDADAYSIEPSNVSLAPGQSRRMRVTLTAPRPLRHEAFIEGQQTLRISTRGDNAQCTPQRTTGPADTTTMQQPPHNTAARQERPGVSARLIVLPPGGPQRVALHLRGAFHPCAGPPPAPVQPLRVALCGVCRPAHLHLEDPAQSLTWTVHRPHVKTTGHKSLTRRVTLCNRGGFPLSFRLAAHGPFVVSGVATSVVQDPVRFAGNTWAAVAASQPGALHLPAGESVDVSLRFELPTAQPLADCDHTGDVSVQFANGESQSFVLRARVLHPAVTVAPACGGGGGAALDFGRMHVKSRKTLEVVLTNTTDVEAAWRLRAGGAAASSRATLPSEAQPGARFVAAPFTFEPAEGVLPGKGLLQPRSCRVRVTFEPREARPCRANVAVGVRCGAPCVLTVCGEGSFDERDEADAHLTTLYQ